MNHTIENRLQRVAEEIMQRHAANEQGRLTLHVCGLNHVRASIELREHYALAPSQCARIIRRFATAGMTGQIMVLSTCNRTEIYAFSERPQFGLELREAFLAIGAEAHPAAGPPPIYEYEGMEAARHLFAVGAGLDSMILGENQIKQQIHQAYDICRAEEAAGPQLNRLVEAAHHAGKRIRTETELNAGTLSVGKAAVLKGEQVLGGLGGKKCLLIGAGKIGGTAAHAIAERHPARLWIVNRSMEKAREIGREIGGEAYGLESLECLLGEAEFILGAAWAPELILDAALYERARRVAPRVCIVDVAVPRIIDPGLSGLPGVQLFDIEHMQEITEENRKRRTGQAQKAWQIVEEEVEKYRAALQAAALAPVIQKLRDHLDQIFNEEQAGADAGELENKKISSTQHRIKQRLLHAVIQEVKNRLVD